MIIINTVGDRYFTLNGIRFARIYQPLAQGSEAIGIYSIYDTKQQLQNSTKYNEFSIDGVVYSNQEDTIAAILAVVWSGLTDYDIEQLEGRIENLEENQYSGVVVYSTYAELPNPGVLLVSYKVSNDPTEANNGYYHWDGAIYIKDAGLNVVNVIQKNNVTDAVTGKAVYDFTEQFSKLRNGYSLITRGQVSYDEFTGILSIDNQTYITSKDGQIYILEAGDGIGFELIDNFKVAQNVGGIHMLFVDINIGSTETVLLKTAGFGDSIFDTIPDAGIERIILGQAYFYGNKYLFQMTGITEGLELNLFDISKLAIYGNNSSMLNPNSWAAGIGSPTFDTDTTVAGKMYIAFTSGQNKQIQLSGSNVVGRKYKVKLKARLRSGSSMPVRIGAFTTVINNDAFDIVPTSTEQEFEGEYVASSTATSIGGLAATNTGAEIEITDFEATQISVYDAEQDARIDALEASNIDAKVVRSFGTENFIQSLSKYDKPLTKLCVAGDSLMANDIGGAIPPSEDEGAAQRPIRLDVNNVARRIYDNIKFNPANHRRLDSVDWTKSGTWFSINNTTVWEPPHANTLYHYSDVANSYIEIAVPDGMENFAVICQKRENAGVLNVTLNGGSIASYGLSQIDLDRTPDSVNDIGNPYYTVEYLGLPAGVNTIRLSKENNTEEVRVWGGLYWSGNTMVVHNVAHGGHDMNQLMSDHLTAEVVENDFDAIVFEITIMNEVSHGRSVEQSTLDLINVIDNYFTGKDKFIMTPNPFGDNGAGTNYYAVYSDPTMEDYTNSYRPVLFTKGVPFADIFHFFKLKIENRGGTLETGEGGLWYTWDGQHPNEAGCREWFNMIRFIFENKPIKWD